MTAVVTALSGSHRSDFERQNLRGNVARSGQRGLGTSRKADLHDLRTALLHKRLRSCPLASRRWIATASSARRFTLRMASVHAPSTAVAVTSDASTRVMARYSMRLHAYVVLAQIFFRFLFETASHGFVRPCDRAESGRPDSNRRRAGWLGPGIPLGHCGGSSFCPVCRTEPGRLSHRFYRAPVVLQERLNDELTRAPAARPDLT